MSNLLDEIDMIDNVKIEALSGHRKRLAEIISRATNPNPGDGQGKII